MCGICGICEMDTSVSESTVQAMCQRLIHRGPDGQGVFIDRSVGLGIRRLAVIDVDGGWQPISNEDSTIHIVFNGEIYNYIELRDLLLTLGHVFKTNSDTETILHAYEEYGLDCLRYLNGMFAFAIWDRPRQRLWIARDRLGEKPLYYSWDGHRLVFASEIRAMLPALGTHPTICPTAVYHYLSFQYVPTPHSVFQGIGKLPAAHYLLLEEKHLRLQQYWDVQFLPKWQDDKITLQERLKVQVKRAIKLRLRSDVPLGVFLSGGVDSAIIAAIAAQLLESRPKAYTVAFDEAAFDESQHARELADYVGADHYVDSVRFDVTEDLPRLVEVLDEPFADASALPTYHLCRVTRKAVTVALSGDGGDEVFGGYQRYTLDKLAQFYRWVPPFVRECVIPYVASRMDVARSVTIEANYALGLRRLQQVMSTPQEASILRWGSYFSESQKAELLHPDFLQMLQGDSSPGLLVGTYRQAVADSLLEKTLYTDLKHYLADNGLVKVDRMSMANSLEVRTPYLDHELVEFMARVPEQYKVRGLKRKILLRDTFRNILPPNWDKRPKRGFEVPVSLWFRNVLYDFAYSVILQPQAKIGEFCRLAVVERMLQEHKSGKEDHGRRLWALLILELWLRNV